MVDVALPPQLQQWTLEKTIVRSERSDSALSTPELYESEDKLRIAPPDASATCVEDKETLFQDRYLSSEEDLSSMEPDLEDVLSIEDDRDELLSERDEQVPKVEEKPQLKPCDLAVVVSYMSVGRPKMVELRAPPPQGRSTRSTSLGNILEPVEKLPHRPSSLSIASTPGNSTPKVEQTGSRRPSTAKAATVRAPSASRASISSSVTDSGRSSTSSQPSGLRLNIYPGRPSIARATPFSPNQAQQYRASFAAPSPRSSSAAFPPFAPVAPLSPLTPISPTAYSAPSFLDSDPYAGNPSPPKHRRLRSISRTLTLAKIAVLPNSKKPDPLLKNSSMPPTPISPATPMTPQPVATNHFASPKQRRFSQPRMVPRRADEREPAPQLPPFAIEPIHTRGRVAKEKPKMVARGAAEREPPIELPPFPVDGDIEKFMMGERRRVVKKRKSLLGIV